MILPPVELGSDGGRVDSACINWSSDTGRPRQQLTHTKAILIFSESLDAASSSTSDARDLTISTGDYVGFAIACRYTDDLPTTAPVLTLTDGDDNTIQARTIPAPDDLLVGDTVTYFGLALAAADDTAVKVKIEPYGSGVSGGGCYLSCAYAWVQPTGVEYRVPYTPFGYWDDLKFPASGINLPGAASDPTRSSTTGLLVFSKSATNTIAGVAQLPHQVVDGSGLRFHVHARSIDDPAGTGDTVWQLKYKLCPVNGYWPAAFTTASNITLTLGDHVGGLAKHDIKGWAEIDWPAARDSGMIEWQISRLGGDGSDTYDDECELLEVDIHILKHEQPGSQDEYPS